MNEFLKQFLIESREFSEQATEGLLSLEKSPQNADQLDAVFRALHTLKGGAGIVDFLAMERAVHSAEDLLGAARAGKLVLSAAVIGDCLACVDQIVQWLDVIEQSGELPPAASQGEADRIIGRFGAALESGEPLSSMPLGDNQWIPEALTRHPDARRRAKTAIRYCPDPDCFFQGEDPITKLTALPGLLGFEAKSATPWPALNTLDPFRCNLVLIALTQSSVAECAAHLHGHSGACEITAVRSEEPAILAGQIPGPAREVLASQLFLASDGAVAGSLGHLASVAFTASNVLRFCGRLDDAGHLASVAAVTNAKDMAFQLQLALTRVLSEDFKKGSDPNAATDLPKASGKTDAIPRTLRVDAERIDALVRLTGELTVAKNALTHLVKLASTGNNPMAAALKARHASFEHLIGDLQRSVLALRVLPLRVVFQRFPRLMRELAESVGKPIQLQVVGDDTEADKAIVEMLFEPLMHVVRNAVDHGVENAAVRAERGKPPMATIEIRATRQGDRVVIDITDDGDGMNVQRIREVALQRRIATAEALDAMTESELIDLVLAPGFSTATEVTALSGRGVGMDAVRTAVGRVGGSIAIHSVAGRSTRVRFTLPFSVMMTTVMSVEAGGQTFGVPLDSIVETIRVPRNTVAAVGTARAVVVRDQTVPVFDLAEMLGDSCRSVDLIDATIVIAVFAGQRCGLDVDALGERLDIILKPLDGLLAGTPGIAGTTLLGDGRVMLVLDIAELLS